MSVANALLAAFDMGSGAVKLTIAEVFHGKVRQIVYSKQRAVLVAHAVKQSADNRIPPSYVDKIADAMQCLISEGEDISKPIMYRGVATAVYRESTNGTEVIHSLSQRFHFPISIISQEVEGYLGFLTAAQGVLESDLANLVSWDTGGASFQLAAIPSFPKGDIKDMKLVEGPLGSSKVTSMMVEQVQGNDFKQTQSVNPCSLDHCEKLLNYLSEKLTEIKKPEWIGKESLVVGIGGHSCAFRMVNLVTGLSAFTKEDIWCGIKKIRGKSDAELQEYPECEMLVPKMLLVSAVMDYFNIYKVMYSPSNGSTAGMFMYSPLWNECE